MNSSRLEIKGCRYEDSGIYSLIIKNPAGQARTNTNLIVHEYNLKFDFNLKK